MLSSVLVVVLLRRVVAMTINPHSRNRVSPSVHQRSGNGNFTNLHEQVAVGVKSNLTVMLKLADDNSGMHLHAVRKLNDPRLGKKWSDALDKRLNLLARDQSFCSLFIRSALG